ncbi:3'(2'),5'-bisphosphate nucleotidase [Rhodobacteraceae bacterium RKSG542]|uniref:3'(2'),5'-bisphosphate nucleotidase CysQ n=1 Tax=Pseudovibrio flavus TaxID=2529854 RepID=UPI0012BC1EB0|nr:3'(2'),5'-bisphosphate nucleotidase CysQ [Pseudovibrio flavus]MTI17560.1 3'(2'),5'-bisphosphate nucleotidase [Pseudovibrio flavus]
MIECFIEAAVLGGKKIMDIYEGDMGVALKKDGTPVTIADQAAEEVILSHLQANLPPIPVVAEEASSAGNIPDTSERFILVDPLDGTREFIKRNGEFTVNIALIENGTPTAGVIYAPALGELFWGEAGKGAYKATVEDGVIGAPQEISCRKTMTAPKVLGSRSHMSEETLELVNRCSGAELIAAGSSLKFCRLAEGVADFYPRVGPTMEWDTAAGHAILLAAGGTVIVEGGEPLTYGKCEEGDRSAYANPSFVAVADEEIISRYGLSSNW